jgi:quinol-cytochrome oxidoreductase complex cytochrome b subunit
MLNRKSLIYKFNDRSYTFVNHKLVKDLMAHTYGYPTPSNLNYFWGFGSLIGCFLVLQIISGLILSIHYNCTTEAANGSVEYILRDISFGWFFKYLHSTVASLLFFFLYIHIGKAVYFRMFKKALVWRSGLIIFFLMMGISFLGYTLPFGQMSL